MTQLTPTLYAVEVPSDARNPKLYSNLKIPSLKYFIGNKNWESILLQLGNFKILGEVTKDEISFDVDIPNHGILNNKYAFRSLLQSKGIDLNKENVKLIILEKL